MILAHSQSHNPRARPAPLSRITCPCALRRIMVECLNGDIPAAERENKVSGISLESIFSWKTENIRACTHCNILVGSQARCMQSSLSWLMLWILIACLWANGSLDLALCALDERSTRCQIKVGPPQGLLPDFTKSAAAPSRPPICAIYMI